MQAEKFFKKNEEEEEEEEDIKHKFEEWPFAYTF